MASLLEKLSKESPKKPKKSLANLDSSGVYLSPLVSSAILSLALSNVLT